MSLHRNYIDSEWVESGSVIRNINPSDISDVIGEYASATPEQTATAIAAASAASHDWSRSSIQQRSDLLDAVASEILTRKEELGTLLAREEGKTLAESIGETVRAAQIFKFFSGEALRITGEKLSSVRPGVDVEITREPVGVVGAITPWNFPIAIPAWKIAPALAYGNCAIFKPASLTPGCAWALSDIIVRAGVPDGVFNLVMGSGGNVGGVLLDDRRVGAVSFTGSVETGASVARSCSARGAKAQLEMGGKNPLVVLDDANLETAVDCAINGAFFSTGQRCTASSRIIVTDGIYEQFMENFVKKTITLKVGPALDEKTQIGPAADQSQLEAILKYIDIGVAEGAELLCGGERVSCDTEGYYVSPAIFARATNEMRISREEIFGPVATVIRVRNYEEAVAIANDTQFGLSAGICTTSLSAASRFKRDSEAGMVMVNLPIAGVDYHVPFGGRKGSSCGPREQGRYAAEFYTIVKTAYTAP